MKFAFATAFLVGSAAAFAPSFGTRSASSLKSTATETYSYAKSEEIFNEAKTVSKFNSVFQYTRSLDLCKIVYRKILKEQFVASSLADTHSSWFLSKCYS